MQNIGKGSFSKVKKVIRTNKKETDGDETTAFAMKMMHKPALEKQRAVTYTDKGEMEMITQLDKVYNEVENWATVHHPNIIKLYEIIDDDKHDYIYVILELADMGQIAKWNPNNEQYERQ